MKRLTAAEARAEITGPKRQDVEGPIHKGILKLIPLIMPGAKPHHSPNEQGMAGDAAARARAKRKCAELGTRPGWPDIEWLWRGVFYSFEVKSPKGVVSDDQIECGKYIVAQGGRWVVVRSVDEGEMILKGWRQQADGLVDVPFRGQIT